MPRQKQKEQKKLAAVPLQKTIVAKMKSKKQTRVKKLPVQKIRVANFFLTNGHVHSEPLTFEEASISPLFRQRVKESLKQQQQQQQHAILFELEGATQQNLADLVTFLQMALEESTSEKTNTLTKIDIKFPVRSLNIEDTILKPEWLSSYAKQLVAKNDLADLLRLLHCAAGLHLFQLEQTCLACIATKLKGRTIHELRQTFEKLNQVSNV